MSKAYRRLHSWTRRLARAELRTGKNSGYVNFQVHLTAVIMPHHPTKTDKAKREELCVLHLICLLMCTRVLCISLATQGSRHRTSIHWQWSSLGTCLRRLRSRWSSMTSNSVTFFCCALACIVSNTAQQKIGRTTFHRSSSSAFTDDDWDAVTHCVDPKKKQPCDSTRNSHVTVQYGGDTQVVSIWNFPSGTCHTFCTQAGPS